MKRGGVTVYVKKWQKCYYFILWPIHVCNRTNVAPIEGHDLENVGNDI